MASPTLGPFAEIGMVGDSLTTGNEGSLGAVILYLPLAASLLSSFSGSTPRTQGGPGSGGVPAGVSTFNRGGPNWHVYGADGFSIEQVRGNMNSFMPRNITHLFFEAGTNDVTNSISPATSNTELIGAMTGTVDAAIDSLMATLKASVQAQTGTNSLGQAIQFVYVDMRTAAITQLAASGNPPPWQNAGYLTVDGRHPAPGGIDVTFRTAMLANLTVSP
jgi:hypothetical protein